MQGMVGLRRSCTVIRHSFENDPSGTEENGLFLSGGRAMRNRLPRIGLIYYVWSHTPNHAEKYDIKTAGSGLAILGRSRGWSGVAGQT